ncbi:hypothetical protein RAC89_08270 [Paenibacillus sp. GD4]|uniref:hypothetical protein n=1 Tax=Paenibacillus sp. GD4 TaxID=3068890 RepID=UPI002796802C|nr:hypothetical protein [Paenibacillus sp. GD4]MDQ1910493.1 hypothetical protein [Paenibacillus sp. GD4]
MPLMMRALALLVVAMAIVPLFRPLPLCNRQAGTLIAFLPLLAKFRHFWSAQWQLCHYFALYRFATGKLVPLIAFLPLLMRASALSAVAMAIVPLFRPLPPCNGQAGAINRIFATADAGFGAVGARNGNCAIISPSTALQRASWCD